MAEILQVKSAFMKKVIDTRAVFKIGGIGLAFKKVNSKLNHINISCILPPAHEREVLIFISQYTYTCGTEEDNEFSNQ